MKVNCSQIFKLNNITSSSDSFYSSLESSLASFQLRIKLSCFENKVIQTLVKPGLKEFSCFTASLPISKIKLSCFEILVKISVVHSSIMNLRRECGS